MYMYNDGATHAYDALFHNLKKSWFHQPNTEPIFKMHQGVLACSLDGCAYMYVSFQQWTFGISRICCYCWTCRCVRDFSDVEEVEGGRVTFYILLAHSFEAIAMLKTRDDGDDQDDQSEQEKHPTAHQQIIWCNFIRSVRLFSCVSWTHERRCETDINSKDFILNSPVFSQNCKSWYDLFVVSTTSYFIVRWRDVFNYCSVPEGDLPSSRESRFTTILQTHRNQLGWVIC